MTANDSTASSTTKKTNAEQDTNIYKTLFMVTAPITALLAGACVWMGVQLSSTSPASQATPAASASAQLPADETNAEPSQTNPNNLAIMESFVRHDPYCTKFAQEIDPELADLVADGTLRVEWYDLAQITDSSPLAAQAGIAAGEQGKFWEFHDAVYAAADPNGHPQYSEQALVDFAAKAGVPDLDKFRATMRDPLTVTKVSSAKEQAHQAGITGTPTLFINKAYIPGFRDAAYVRNTVLAQLAETAS